MTLYFLHVRDGEKLILDPSGAEFENVEAARTEAVYAAQEILAELLRHGDIVDGKRFEITDEQGEVHGIVLFSDAIRLPGR